MITVRITGLERQHDNPDEIEEGWITEQVNRRRLAGERVCINVHIDTSSVRAGLSTHGCPVGGGGRRPNRDEQRVFDLWADRGLNEPNFAVGQLIAFLHQLHRFL